MSRRVTVALLFSASLILASAFRTAPAATLSRRSIHKLLHRMDGSVSGSHSRRELATEPPRPDVDGYQQCQSANCWCNE